MAIALNKNIEKFMIYIAILLATPTIQILFFYQTQIGLLLTDKTFIEIFLKYLDYTNIFLFNLMIKLPKNTTINKHLIKLVKDKQLLYKTIYSLKLVELRTLKTYIKNYLKTRFI